MLAEFILTRVWKTIHCLHRRWSLKKKKMESYLCSVEDTGTENIKTKQAGIHIFQKYHLDSRQVCGEEVFLGQRPGLEPGR